MKTISETQSKVLSVHPSITFPPLTPSELMILFEKGNIPLGPLFKPPSIIPLERNRYQTIIESLHLQLGKEIRVIIDVSFHAPTWQQFIDITYNQGAGCDFKVILFNKEQDDEDYSSDAYIIDDRVRINNKCSVPTYLVNANGNLTSPKNRMRQLDVMESPDHVQRDPNLEFPSKRTVEEAGFWLPFYWGTFNNEMLGHEIDDLEGTSSYGLRGHLDSIVNWNDEGLFMELSTESDDQAIKWLWERKKKEIEDKYPGSTLHMTQKKDGFQALSLRVDKTPFTDCLQSSPREKDDYVGLVHGNELKFMEIIEGYLDEYNSEQKNKNNI